MNSSPEWITRWTVSHKHKTRKKSRSPTLKSQAESKLFLVLYEVVLNTFIKDQLCFSVILSVSKNTQAYLLIKFWYKLCQVCQVWRLLKFSVVLPFHFRKYFPKFSSLWVVFLCSGNLLCCQWLLLIFALSAEEGLSVQL